MNLPAVFIRRKVAATLLTLGLVLFGLLGFSQMPVSPLPKIAFPTIQVQASMAGASPATMAATVAEPLERHLGTISDVSEMTSQSSLGTTRIVLQFNFDRDVDGAARDVEAAIQASRVDLPSTLRANPTYEKFNPADAPIFILALTSPTLTPGQLYDSASTVIQQQFLQITGVGDVELGGAALPAVRVEVQPGALARYGIGLEDVRAAIAAANANAPKGYVNNNGLRYQIYTNDQASKAAQYQNLVIAYRNGQAVRLVDIAQVTNSVQNLQNAGYYNGQKAVLVIVHATPDANIISTIDSIKAGLPALRAALPPSVSIGVAMDRSVSIRAALEDTERALFVAVLLVVAVVFVFLRSGPATLIPGLAVPVSIIGTFGPMYLLGYSIDTLSLMALTIATGFVVDDAVVVVENTMRHIEAGMDPVEAAIKGSGEVAFTVMSMSASLVAVFLPILLMPGLMGKFFQEFSETLCIAIGISLVVSLTATPMLCALLLRPETEHKRSRFHRQEAALERWFVEVQASYETSLRWALRHAGLVGAGLALTVVLNVVLFVVVPKGFLPEQDNGLVIGNVQADQGISFAAMTQKMLQLQAIIQKDPGIASVASFTGGRSANTAMLFITLKPLNVRHASAQDIVARLRRPMMHIAGAQAFLVAAQDFRMGGRQGNAEYQYTLRSDNAADLYTWVPKIVAVLQKNPALTDVNSDVQQGGLETQVRINRTLASAYGLTPQQIDAALYDAFGQRNVSTIYNELNQYSVVMELAPEYQKTPQDLARIYVSTSGGKASGTGSTQLAAGAVGSTSTSVVALDSASNAAVNAIAASGHSSASSGTAVSTTAETMVPLSAIASFAPGTAPVSVNHDDGRAAATISFSLPVGGALGKASAAIAQTMAQLDVPLTISGSFAGTAAAFASSTASEPLLILAAICTVYIVLGVLYESFIHPLTILSTIPSAGVGATLFLLLVNTPLTVIALIGVILLIGIVKKNAILMIDFALQLERGQGLSPEEAICQAALLRLRPILMTTFAAMLGALPLALGVGQGGSFRQPLGLTIIGGLAVSQMLTLYTTPVVYLGLERLATKLRGGKRDPALPRGGRLVEDL